MAPGTNLTAQSPRAGPGPRVPKLKYRNPLPPDQISPSSQTSFQEMTRPPLLQRHISTTSSEFPTSPFRPSFETSASATSSSVASINSSASSSNESKAPKKKKNSSVFSFLTLKEPSQLALEQFTEQQRKQGNGKGTISPSTSSVRTSASFASKKLPDSVPKVNSKWDGIPDAVKRRQSTAATANRRSKDTKRSSGSSFEAKGSHISAMPWNNSEFSVMSNESRGPPPSIASRHAGINADIYHNGHYVPSSPSENSLSEPSYYSPEEPMASGALPVEHSNASNHVEVDSLASRPHPTTDLERITDEPESLRSASPASSADSVDTVVRAEADAIYEKLNDRPQQQGFWSDSATATRMPSESGSKPSVPESHDFLFDIPSSTPSQKNDSPMASPPVGYLPLAVSHTESPAHYAPSIVRDKQPAVAHYTPSRPVLNFSRPRAPSILQSNKSFQSAPPTAIAPSSLRSRAMSSGLPTLYENSIASTESLETIRDDNDAASFAPSELSEHWYQSPRDRLGLGGQMRKGGVLPWTTVSSEDTSARDSQQPS